MTDFKKATAGPFLFTDDPGLHMEDGSTLAVGFRPDAATTGATVSLAQSLSSQPGVHVFLKCSRGLPPLEGFGAELQRLLDDPGYWNSRIMFRWAPRCGRFWNDSAAFLPPAGVTT